MNNRGANTDADEDQWFMPLFAQSSDVTKFMHKVTHEIVQGNKRE